MNTETLSPTSSLRLRFDQLSPECDDDTEKHLLWWGGRRMSVPPFVSHKFVAWFEDGLCHENHRKQMIMFRGYKVLKKVLNEVKSVMCLMVISRIFFFPLFVFRLTTSK